MEVTGTRRARLPAAGWLIIFLALTFPINYVLFLGLRITDVVALLLVLVCLSDLRVRSTATFTLTLVFFALYAVSMTYGIMVLGVVKPSNFLLGYKYLMPFLLVWVITSRVGSNFETSRIAKVMSIVFLALVAYAYLYFLLWAAGFLQGNIRVTFPFTNDPESRATDAHLFSVVLSNCLVGYLFLAPGSGKRRVLPTIGIVFLTIGAMILSGSRTGLLSIMLTFLFIAVQEIFTRLVKGKIRFTLKGVAVVLLIVAALYLALFRLTNFGMEGLSFLVGRIFSLDFAGDVSVGGRLIKARYVIDQILNGPLVIGLGMQSTHHTWFDNAYMAVIFSTGFAGLLVLLSIVLIFLRERRNEAVKHGTLKDYTALKYLFINYLLCGISSEFFLVTRGLVPFVVLVGVFTNRIRNGEAYSPSQRGPAPVDDVAAAPDQSP